MALGPAAATTAAKVGFKVIGETASKAYGAVAGTSRALGALSGALNSAAKNLPENQQSPTNVIYINFGMAGSAGRQRVASGGNLPAQKNTANPQVSEKMPTEALLDTAVKYLTSIDKSLKAQLEFEKRSYEQQARDERESIIEEKKPSFSFSDIKDRLSGFKSSAQEAGSTLATIAKFTAGIGAAAALAASSLDTKQLEELQANINAFTDKFSFLSEIPDGGLGGFLVGLLFGKGIKGRFLSGVKGGLIGILTSAIADTIFSRITGGEISEDTKSVLNIGAAAGIGYLGYRGIKSGMQTAANLRTAQATMAEQRANRSYYNPNSQRVQNAATGRMMATNTATGFLKSPRWQRFLNWLTNNGKRALVTKIQQRIAIAVGTGAVTATGVGAAFGAIGFLLNLGFSLFLMYEIYQLWQEFTSQDKAEEAGVGDAEIAKEINQPNATRVAGSTLAADRVMSKSETGRPEEAQAFFENKGWTREQAAGIVGNLVVESGLKTDAYNEAENAYGIAQWRSPRQAIFRQVYGKDIKNSSFQEQLEFVNWELNNSEKAAGNALRGATSAEEAAAIVDSKYERSAGIHLAERQANATAIMAGDFSKVSTGGASGYSGGGGDSAMSKIANASLETMGKLFGAIGGAVVSPGIARNLTPSVSNAPERINDDSMKVNNDIALGIRQKESKETVTNSTIPSAVSGSAQPIVSISSIDPNYGNIDILTKYLAHFRLAA